MGIKHERVVVTRDKGMAADWNADHVIDGDIDLGQYSFLNQVIENRTDFPAGPVEGQIIYRTDLNLLYTYNGTSWESCVMAESTQTITGNKTFSGDQTFNGSVTFDIQTGDIFLLKDDFYNWIKYDYADGTMSMGQEVGADWTEIDFYGTIGFNRTPLIINPNPTANGHIVHKQYVDDLVAIPTGTYYWSTPGSDFISTSPDTDNVYIDADNGTATAEAGTLGFSCSVNLPHGAVITKAIVYSQGTVRPWYLLRDTHARSGSPGTMASANTNTEDTTITNPTIDNSAYSYWIEVYPVTSVTIIDSVRITYTL